MSSVVSARLVDAARRFSNELEECRSPEQVLDKLHDTVEPRINVLGSWRVSLKSRRASREPYTVYLHRSVSPRWLDAYWREFKNRGPSFLAQHVWRNRGACFTQSELIRTLKPSPEELWIVRLNRDYGIGDVLYCATADWWFVVYWSPKPLRVSSDTRRALKLLAELASKRIEALVGPHDDEGSVLLAPREREVFRLVVSNGTAYLPTERQIAKQLKVSENTIKVHVARVKKKLGVKTLQEAAIEIVRRYIVLALALGFELAVVADHACDFYTWARAVNCG
jgi:DNA-binding CsgD family transcriptional regulator